ADSKYLSSYDPTTGTELWRVECPGGEVAPSPVYAEGTVFAAQESVACVAVSIANDEPNVTWRYDEYLPDVASPLATPQYVFLATSRGVIVCLDAQKGTELWRHEFGEGFYASPILVGNLVYALDRKGIMRIFEAAPTFKEKGNPTLSEPAVATPAFVENRIFVRTEKNLYCIGQ
ncbi:MAG: outer membrane protein assembly factor BamB family protein, partial [Kiritimatiellia bacterium]